MQAWENDAKRVQSALCTRMRIVLSGIRLDLKTSVWREKMSLSCLLYQAVMWPTVQLHNTGSTSKLKNVDIFSNSNANSICKVFKQYLYSFKLFRKLFYHCFEHCFIPVGESGIFSNTVCITVSNCCFTSVRKFWKYCFITVWWIM